MEILLRPALCESEALPEVPCRDRAIRSPALPERHQPGGCPGDVLAIQPTDRDAEPVVANRQNIFSSKPEDEDHFGGPAADPPTAGEVGDDRLVVEVLQSVELQVTGDGARGEITQRGQLGAREPGCPQLVLISGEQRVWRHLPAEAGVQPRFDRCGGPGGDLLTDDSGDEGSEGWLTTPRSKRADGVDDGGEGRVDGPKMADGLARHRQGTL